MKVIVAAALLTALTAGWLVHPLMKGDGKSRRAGLVILFILPLAALGLYLAAGSPDMPSRAALFETETPGAAIRALSRQEQDAMKKLAAAPDDPAVRAELGEILYAQGLAALMQQENPVRAQRYFDRALEIAPADASYRKKLESDRNKISNSR